MKKFSLQKHNNIFMYFTEKFKEQLYLWYYKLLGPEGLEVWNKIRSFNPTKWVTALGEDPRASNSYSKFLLCIYHDLAPTLEKTMERVQTNLINRNLVAKGSLIFSDFSKSSLSSLMIVKYLLDDLGC